MPVLGTVGDGFGCFPPGIAKIEILGRFIPTDKLAGSTSQRPPPYPVVSCSLSSAA
jgi:hypothetical protein